MTKGRRRRCLGGPLKEFMIGVRVYEKRAIYDTKEEPIVRIEARRLRAKLEEYYAAEGLFDEVLIEVPKGGYMPRFAVREAVIRYPRSRCRRTGLRRRSPSNPRR